MYLYLIGARIALTHTHTQTHVSSRYNLPSLSAMQRLPASTEPTNNKQNDNNNNKCNKKQSERERERGRGEAEQSAKRRNGNSRRTNCNDKV